MKTWISLLAAVLLLPATGCRKGDTPTPPAEESAVHVAGDDRHHDDHHHFDSPHGGIIADWGAGDYHVEFTVDHDTQTATVYILGDDAQTPVAVPVAKLLLTINEPSFQLELTANPQPDDPEGNASRFTGQHEQLGVEREFAGTVIGEIDGTPYAADFDEAASGHVH